MENTLLKKFELNKAKTISIFTNRLNDLDLDKIIDQMEKLMDRFDEVFAIPKKHKVKNKKILIGNRDPFCNKG